ncbi:MAG: DegT/DnrJ/EryC1/StrS family aminotransferase [Acidobacteria bacterium]|nr:MAG: DegT/DnrJ/EryC1/StrS family aminotransferase [Acidobacteriota bacterium]REK01466.1 MAG: DegT/DnrJ/EryC1/StrS family aminotransferase [Acidobacteriota bacterium]REK14422.1 MAG: DegT/DnrJ/EryC1/StrS family aminotransferase [Acidobacteriota bacterium]REK45137.1 MAG: DegT/DnrJ/EryC1/StrS family aminotransferase [Acidobacteriota bacterium]
MQRNMTGTVSLATNKESPVRVPFFRPHLKEEEVEEVASTLRSGWLTTGPRAAAFEQEFAKAVNGRYAVALNSCTAALHLAVEAIGLREGDAVLIPTMTFAATAEIILYKKAVPVLVDCDPVTGNMDLEDAERKIAQLNKKTLPYLYGRDLRPVGIIPVHVGGYMLDVDEVKQFASKHDLWVIEDAAHAFPAAWRPNSSSPWKYCGDNTSSVTCYSFYANKTITTGEGGMAVTNDEELADKIRLMSLHGLSHDAWGRYTGGGKWDYQIVRAGYKYNLTDIAAAIGLKQLDRAEEMRKQREDVARYFLSELGSIEEIGLPPENENRIHSWHLFPIRLKLPMLKVDRNEFIDDLNKNNVGTSVHWRPLHKHPLYRERLGWSDNHCPSASQLWKEIISLPIFSAMNEIEMDHVVQTVKDLCFKHSKSSVRSLAVTSVA